MDGADGRGLGDDHAQRRARRRSAAWQLRARARHAHPSRHRAGAGLRRSRTPTESVTFFAHWLFDAGARMLAPALAVDMDPDRSAPRLLQEHVQALLRLLPLRCRVRRSGRGIARAAARRHPHRARAAELGADRSTFPTTPGAARTSPRAFGLRRHDLPASGGRHGRARSSTTLISTSRWTPAQHMPDANGASTFTSRSSRATTTPFGSTQDYVRRSSASPRAAPLPRISRSKPTPGTCCRPGSSSISASRSPANTIGCCKPSLAPRRAASPQNA